MAKRRDAPYQPGRRSSAWWKVKCGRRREFVVGGWSTGSGGRRESIGSLALGVYGGAGEGLRYVGQAGSGLNEEMIRQLQKLFAQIGVDESPFVNPTLPKLHYVRPLLVAEIAYTEVTETGTLRQPSIKGLRTDLVAAEVTWDEEIAERFSGEEQA